MRKQIYFRFLKFQRREKSCVESSGLTLLYWRCRLHACQRPWLCACSQHSVPSILPASACCLFVFLPSIPNQCFLLVPLAQIYAHSSASMFPSASSLNTPNGAILCFPTFPVNFKPVDIGGIYCSMLLPASLLPPCVKVLGEISPPPTLRNRL